MGGVHMIMHSHVSWWILYHLHGCHIGAVPGLETTVVFGRAAAKARKHESGPQVKPL